MVKLYLAISDTKWHHTPKQRVQAKTLDRRAAGLSVQSTWCGHCGLEARSWLCYFPTIWEVWLPRKISKRSWCFLLGQMFHQNLTLGRWKSTMPFQHSYNQWSRSIGFLVPPGSKHKQLSSWNTWSLGSAWCATTSKGYLRQMLSLILWGCFPPIA